MKYSTLVLLLILLGVPLAKAQIVPVGTWVDHLPYRSCHDVTNGDQKIYCAAEYAVFSFDKKDKYMLKISKATGLSDIGIRRIKYHPDKKLLLIAYENGNLDIYSSGQVSNIPDLKDANSAGGKIIHHINFSGSLAYLSVSFGIIVLDLDKKEIKDTYRIGPGGTDLEVFATASDGENLFAATKNGIYRASLVNGDNLLSFNSWHLQGPSEGIASGKSELIETFGGTVYGVVNDSIFRYENSSWSFFYSAPGWTIINLSAEGQHLLVTEWKGNEPPDSTRFTLLDSDQTFSRVSLGNSVAVPKQAIEDESGLLWVADFWKGLIRYDFQAATSYYPNGPWSNRIYAMDFAQNTLWVAPGAINNAWNFTYNKDGFFRYENHWWINNHMFNTPELSGVFDIVAVMADPQSGITYFGSHASGVIKFDHGQIEIWDKNNTPLKAPSGDTTRTHIGGFALDADRNLWMTNNGTSKPLVVRTPDGNWYSYALPQNIRDVSDILIDQQGRLWIIEPRNTNFGLVVYDYNNTPDDPSDDQAIALKQGIGQGNLPSNEVNCIAMDHDGEIWIGTDAGISVFYCPWDVINGTCDAAPIIVEQDGFLAYLFESEIVNDIEVDGANRKWIATNNGVWLMSPDGTEQIEYFNASNSPLLSDEVLDVAIDPESGTVYFGTSKGIISYRGTATEGSPTHSNVTVFPNPVREDYHGPIAIKGLVENAYVKITDVSGNLVYSTRALGGQAIWNGLLPNGQRAQTGVYLIFSMSEDGTETFVSKLLLIH